MVGAMAMTISARGAFGGVARDLAGLRLATRVFGGENGG